MVEYTPILYFFLYVRLYVILPYLNAIILLLTASPMYSYPELIAICHDIVVFMYDLYLWMCIYVSLISMYLIFVTGHHGRTV